MVDGKWWMEDAWKLEKEGSCWGEKTEERVVAQIGNLFNATPTLLLLLPCLFSLFLSLHSLIHSLPYTHSLSLPDSTASNDSFTFHA